jgi:large subunit ribosomal protein L18
MKTNPRVVAQQRRRMRVRRKIVGAAERPRLCLRKSSRHLYAQVVDDRAGRTLAAATTNVKAVKSEAKSFCNMIWAKKLGAEIGRKAKERGVENVVFDRSGSRYHGVVRAFADAAREAGLKF